MANAVGGDGVLQSAYAIQQSRTLIVVRLVHTLVWSFFFVCILALPIVGLLRRFDWAAILTAPVLLEIAALALNGWRCPLTNLAARFATETPPGFDIYLPQWLARLNKPLFGTLFLVIEGIVLYFWLR